MTPNPIERRLKANHQQAHPFGFRGKAIKRMSGVKDPRGRIGIFARGKNVYNGGSMAAHHKKGYGMGRPPKAAIRRRMGEK